MKKVLSLVLAFTLVLGMMPTAFAAETGSAGEMLLQYKFINGGANGELMEDKALDREQFAVILATLNGKEEEAAKFEGALNFKDADKISKWAVPYVAYAVEQNWLKGNDKNEFMPAQTLSGQEILSSLLRVLGYEVEWANVVKEAETLGFTATEGELNRGQAFETLWKVVKEIPAKGADQPLGVALGKLEAEKPVVTDLKVESVTVTNLKQVAVLFNQEVDKDTVVNANFVIKKGNATQASTAALAEDGKTVVLTLSPLETGALTNQTAYTVTVDKVKSATGQVIAKTTESFSAFDGTLPTVEKLVFVGPKTVKLTFSEPIVKKADHNMVVKSGNSSISIDKANIKGWGTNEITVDVYTSFKENTAYSLTVTGFEDFAGYKNVVKTFEETFVKDVTPPTAKVVKATQEYVVVEFDKPVTGVTSTHFSHTFTAWNAIAVTAEEKLYDDKGVMVSEVSTGTKFVVWFHDAITTDTAKIAKNRPIEAGTRNLNVSVKNAAGTEIKDYWSNKFADTTIQFTVAADTDAPKVVEVAVKTEKSFTVEFNKNVTVKKDNIEILDKDGKAVSGLSYTVSGSGKLYTVTLGKDYPGQTFVVNVKGVKDTTLLTNAMPTYTETITIGDKTAPVINKATIEEVAVTGGDNYFNIYVFFNEDMDSEATLVAANYQLMKADGTAFTSLTGTPEFVNGVKTVKIKLTATQKANYDAGQNYVFVTNVKDVAGNAIAVKTKAIATHSTAITPMFDLMLDANGDAVAGSAKVYATGDKQIKIYFDQELATVNSKVGDLDAFVVNGTDQKVSSIDVELVNGKTVVTLNLAKALEVAYDNTSGSDVLFVTNDLTVTAKAVVNLFGVENSELTVITNTDADSNAKDTIFDKNAPRVSVVDDKAQIKTDNTGVITIEFTEQLAADTGALYAQDIVVVKGSTTLTPGTDYVAKATAGQSKIEITKDGTAPLADGEYKVYSKDAITYIKDTNGNKAAKFTTAFDITVDNTDPQIASAKENTDAKVLTVTFNEAMDKTKVETAVNWAVTGGASQANVVSVSLDTTGKIATVTFDAALIDANVVTVSVVTDVIGNAIDTAKDAVLRGNEAAGSGTYTVQ